MVKATFLKGMKEITAYVGFSEATILKHKRNYPGMPIRLECGRWLGDPEALEQFYKDLAAGRTDGWLEVQADVSKEHQRVNEPA